MEADWRATTSFTWWWDWPRTHSKLWWISLCEDVYTENTATVSLYCLFSLSALFCMQHICFVWPDEKKKTQVLIKEYFFTARFTVTVLQLKGTTDYEWLQSQQTPYIYLNCRYMGLLRLSDVTPRLLCLSSEEWGFLTDPRKLRFQKRPHSHQFMRWHDMFPQVPPHHPVSLVGWHSPYQLYSGVTSSLMRGTEKWSWGFPPQDI